MYILGIETTGAFASVALMKDDTVIGHVQGQDRFSHLQNLMPQVESVVKDNKLSIDDIDVIAVSKGPGSFTGIRIGVSSARALSQMLNIPCIGVPTLEGLALRAEEISGENGILDENTLICPILDARRSQVYGGGYYVKEGQAHEVIKAAPYTVEEFLSKAEKHNRILLFGDGTDAYGEKIGEIRSCTTFTAPEDIRYQDAVTVAKLGTRIFKEQGGVSYYDLQPEYMRLAEAERKLKEKQQKG